MIVNQDETIDEPLKFLKERTPRELWPAYFRSKPSSNEIRLTIRRLHSRQEYEHVVAALETALKQGNAEPWMYEVLALTMKIVGRPQAQIDRVLFSIVDVGVQDVPNLLVSAAYLARLGADEQALKLYRQVSQLQPDRPETYSLALRHAGNLDDLKHIIWAATGVLQHDWLSGYASRHQQAKQLLSNKILKLQNSGDTQQANQIRQELAQAQIRDLRVKLIWSGEADLDLAIQEPGGTACSYGQRWTSGGGVLLHEGAGPNQDNCYEEYVCHSARAGYYTIEINHASGRIVGNRARLQIIRYEGSDHEQRSDVNVVFDRREKKFRISLHRGRREQQKTIYEPIQETAAERRQRTRMTLARIGQQMRYRPGINAQVQNMNLGAVGFSPVIAPVSSGANLSAQAIVSPDRRYVRIGVNPQFTQVTDVFTFSFATGNFAGGF